jgi:hypothetical protein
MKTFSQIPVALFAAAISLTVSNSVKAAVIFDFTSENPINSQSKSFSAGGINLTANNSNSTGTNPGTLNTNNKGLCAFASVGSSTGRCGYGTDPASGVSAFEFSFDRSVFLNTLDISDFSSSFISAGQIKFSPDNINFIPLNFTGLGTLNLGGIELAANQTFFVQTSATFSGENETGLFRINNLNVTDVPGPIGFMGFGAALGWSRQIKKKLSS